jgi:SPP1 gp7 family putative phage head morphogenesis protein
MIPVSMAGMSLLPETEETEPEETPPGEEPEEEEERSFPLPHTLAKTHRLVRRRSGVYVVRRADGEKEAFRLALWRGLIARRRDLEIRFEQIVRRHMHALQVEVDNNIRSIKGWSASRKMREAIARETPPPLFAELRIKAEGDLVFDRYLADKGIRLATRETFKQALRRGGESLAAELGPSFTFDMLRPEVMSRLSTLTLKIAGINETLERALRASLAEGLAAGEGVDSLAQRAQNVFAVGKTRARAIARTETGGAFTAGREAAMKENGIKNHEWLSSRDDKVRQTHKDEDGSVVAIGTPFPHTKLKHPHDPAGPAEEVINCRCDVLPVVA